MEENQKPDRETYQRWHDDPANWKLGIFYFNPKDKRIFPPKRVEALGWTLNFANPLSIVVAVILIVVIGFILQYMFNWH